jgi:anti-anti-sigma regulatory factor
MSHKSSHVPQETYHRIYWYVKRNVDPRVIAHTLKLPLKTVEHIIERFSENDRTAAALHNPSAAHSHVPVSARPDAPVADEDFLDMFLFVKTRYAIMDISGMVTKRNIHKLTTELQKLRSSDLKAVALCMTDVLQLDKDGLDAIVSFHDDFKKANRFTAVLDPSPDADSFIAGHEAAKKLPVFGTETAFEAHAFS